MNMLEEHDPEVLIDDFSLRHGFRYRYRSRSVTRDSTRAEITPSQILSHLLAIYS